MSSVRKPKARIGKLAARSGKLTARSDNRAIATEARGKRAGASRVRAGARVVKSVPALPLPSAEVVLQAVLELGLRVDVDLHEDEIVHAYVAIFRRLFPRRMFCVRLLSKEGATLSLAIATGQLRPERRDLLQLSSEALARHGLAAQALHEAHVGVTVNYEPLFVRGASGFDIPMLDGSSLCGLVSVEYPRGVLVPPHDRALLAQLTVLLCSALKNARSHRRSLYLRDYLGKLLDHANAPIMVMGKQGEVRLANRAFLALTTFSRDELLGKEWMSFLPPSEQRRLWPIYIEALRGEPCTNAEGRLPRRDGSFAQVSVNAASILGPDGEVEGVIYIYRDVTELRALQDQIVHAEKLATLGQLAAGVVHELNNPLTSISVYGEYLYKKAKSGGAEAGDVEKLRRIVDSAERILNFTRDLVSYARPPNEKPVTLDLEELVRQSIEFCAHLIEEVGSTVETRFEPGLPRVYGVKGQLLQVLVNLITNACHAMPLGAGHLTLEGSATGDGRVVLRVADTGKGIPEENLARIFEPFFTTKGEGQGTGLGLSIVRNIVEQHRGEIRVSSEVGRGTTFEIVLPCKSDPRDLGYPEDR